MKISDQEMTEFSKKIAADRTIRALIRQLQGQEWDLEPARILSYEELRSLSISPSAIDFILRRVAEARTKTELLVSLEEFALFLVPGNALKQVLLSRLGVLGRLIRDRQSSGCP